MIQQPTSPAPGAPPPPSAARDPSADTAPPQGTEPYRGITEPTAFLHDAPVWAPYLIAVVLTTATVGIRRWLDVLGEGISPFTLFYPVVLVSTLIGGYGPGIVSLAIAAVAANFLWLEPRGFLAMTGAAPISFMLFLVSIAVNIVVAERLRTTLRRLRDSESRLNLSQDVGRIGIWDLDLRTGGLWWSPSFRKVTGIGPDVAPSVGAFMERIAEPDRERALACFDTARRGLDRLDIDFRFNRDDGSTIWLAGRAELFRDAQGKPTRLLGINFDATPIRTAESERDQANSLLKTFFDSLPGAAFAKDMEGRYLLGNPVFATAVGRPPEFFLGRDDREVLPDAEQARIIMSNDQAIIAGGQMRQIEESLVLPNGETSYWLAVKTPFTDAAGQPRGIMGISLDVTERRKAEERLRFLADEVDHRAKNLLGVVLSLVRLTKVDDVASFKAAVSGRIEALARAHTLLAANRWEGVDIATLVREELAPFARHGSERIGIGGPSLMLLPNASQALAMAIHELAINAAMYGALSEEKGKLSVTWALNERDRETYLDLHWIETDGPEVAPPARAGFGSTAIRGAIEHQLGGEFELTWAPTGILCRLAFPLAPNIATDRSLAASARRERAQGFTAAPEIDLAGKRVLVLEDEALIALTLMDTLRSFGCTIVGPAANSAAALALVQQKAPDLAVLDVNLAGSSSAPVAHVLREAGVPFVYCTGYAEPALQIEPELLAPMLTKPIDPEELAAALRKALGDRQVPVEA